MTVAGVAVTTLAALLTTIGLAGGCSNPTDVTHYDQPSAVAPPAPPAPLPHVGYDSTTWGE